MKFGKIDNFILLGGGSLATKLIMKLKKYNHKVSLITGQRNLKEEISDLQKISFERFLKENKINYIVSKNVNEDPNVHNEITSNSLGISLGAPWILSANFIEKFGGKLLNVHGTRLPQNRGGATWSWQILQNNNLGYCLIHILEPGIDTGPIVKYKEFFYPSYCRTPKEFQEYYINQNLEFLLDFFKQVLNNVDFVITNQSEYFSTYWPRLATEYHGFIDWNWTLEEIELFIRAFDEPYQGASTFIKDKHVFVKNCYINFNDGRFHPFQQGIVYRKNNESIFVATKNGTLIVRNIVDEKGKSFINQINLGDRFYTPLKFLERAKKFRALYTSDGLKDIPSD